MQSIEHIESPALYIIYHNIRDRGSSVSAKTQPNLGHIQYHITATLFEQLELHDFPFDRQFLNIKLRWNTLYFKLLRWDNADDKIAGKKIFDGNKALSKLYYDNPLRLMYQKRAS